MERRVGKVTREELAYVGSMRRRSGLSLLDEGRAEVLSLKDYPEPLRRFLRREQRMVHVKLTAVGRRKLEARSRKSGVPADELARRWIEQQLQRDAG